MDESGSFYNLGFGDVGDDDEIDDVIVTDNNDSKKVLATVAFTVTIFLKVYPGKLVHVFGSTKTRTRLYRMGISNNLEEFRNRFNLYGLQNQWEIFRKNVDYSEFMVGNKNSKFV
jgi:hypothetical protein